MLKLKRIDRANGRIEIADCRNTIENWIVKIGAANPNFVSVDQIRQALTEGQELSTTGFVYSLNQEA